jgi:hypothetical protein
MSTVAAAACTGPLAMPQRTLPADATGKPKLTAQRNFTDPDSHILKGPDGWIQGYNAQATALASAVPSPSFLSMWGSASPSNTSAFSTPSAFTVFGDAEGLWHENVS